MRTYAQIRNSRVRLIQDSEQLPPTGLWVDITDIVPQPQVGWIWDGATFQESQMPVWVANEELYDRFTDNEKMSLFNSADSKVQRFLYELRIRPRIDLRNQKTIRAMDVLVVLNIITEERKNEILGG